MDNSKFNPHVKHEAKMNINVYIPCWIHYEIEKFNKERGLNNRSEAASILLQEGINAIRGKK